MTNVLSVLNKGMSLKIIKKPFLWSNLCFRKLIYGSLEAQCSERKHCGLAGMIKLSVGLGNFPNSTQVTS